MGKASRRKREVREGRRAVVAQMQSEGIAQGMRVATGSRGSKISVALRALIEPYVDGDIGIEEYRSLVMTGALAWNLTVLPEAIPNGRLQSLLATAGAPETTSFQNLLEELRERKQQLLPNDRRFIVRAEVHEQPDGSFYLTVAAAATNKEAADVRR